MMCRSQGKDEVIGKKGIGGEEDDETIWSMLGRNGEIARKADSVCCQCTFDSFHLILSACCDKRPSMWDAVH